MQLYEAICKICQHMKNHEKSFFLHGNFAGQQLIHISYSPDIELGVNMGKRRPNYVAPHVVKPPTVDWLGFTDQVSAAIAVTNKSSNQSSTPPTKCQFGRRWEKIPHAFAFALHCSLRALTESMFFKKRFHVELGHFAWLFACHDTRIKIIFLQFLQDCVCESRAQATKVV